MDRLPISVRVDCSWREFLKDAGWVTYNDKRYVGSDPYAGTLFEHRVTDGEAIARLLDARVRRRFKRPPFPEKGFKGVPLTDP